MEAIGAILPIVNIIYTLVKISNHDRDNFDFYKTQIRSLTRLVNDFERCVEDQGAQCRRSVLRNAKKEAKLLKDTLKTFQCLINEAENDTSPVGTLTRRHGRRRDKIDSTKQRLDFHAKNFRSYFHVVTGGGTSTHFQSNSQLGLPLPSPADTDEEDSETESLRCVHTSASTCSACDRNLSISSAEVRLVQKPPNRQAPRVQPVRPLFLPLDSVPELRYHKFVGEFKLPMMLGKKWQRDKNFTVEISPGGLVALLTMRGYSVFNTACHASPSLLFTGEFDKNGHHSVRSVGVTHNRRQAIKFQQFNCAALSDKFLAVGIVEKSLGKRLEKILIFVVNETLVRHSVCDLDTEGLSTEQLAFSPDCTQLVVLGRRKNRIPEARIYSVSWTDVNELNSTPRIKFVLHLGNIIQWDCPSSSPNSVKFSPDGSRVAICTTLSATVQPEILLLRKVGETWQREPYTLKVVASVSADSNLSSACKGITGIGFLNRGDCLLWSMASSVPEPELWCQLNDSTSSQTPTLNTMPFGPEELRSKTLEMAISHQFNVIAQMDTSGNIFIKQHRSRFPSPVGGGELLPLTESRRRSRSSRRTMLFTESGRRLLVLSAKGDLEVHDFH